MNNDQPTNSSSPQDAASRYEEELANPPPQKHSEPLTTEQLRNESKERAANRPILQKILSVFRKEKGSFRELVINSEPLEKRVALLIDGTLDRFEIERESDSRMVGGIYKGRIKNLDPGLKAAFVDIGYNKNAFLHYWDMLPAATDSSVEVVRVNKKKDTGGQRPALPTVKDIPSMYPPGTDIVIQVTKGPIGTKGPRTTTNLSLPGRYLILTPFSDGCGISRKIEDPQERKRLKTLINELTIPEGMGVIVRTAGEGKKPRYFVRDLHLLLTKWQEIMQKMENDRAPTCLYQEPDIVERTVRDFLTEDIDRVLIDNEADYKRTQELVAQISSRSRGKIAYYKEAIPVFERYNIERQIEQLFQRRVPLPSGGEIVIDETEALTAIDVNTGGHRGKDGAKDGNFITQANLEAVTEAARQIKLRNLGGLIMIDTIDMKNPKDRKKVFDTLRDAMEDDRAKHQILPISQLGVLQMTRQRHTESNTTSMYTACPHCQGRGIVKNPRTVSVEIQRKLLSVIRRLRESLGPEKEIEINILLHPVNLERIITEDREFFRDLMKSCKVRLGTKPDPTYSIEAFKLFDGAGKELR